jgi:integrase
VTIQVTEKGEGEMTVSIHQVTSREKHGKKIWYFRWDDPISGKRREMSARTRREANLKRNMLITRAEDGSMPITKGKAKVVDVVRTFLNARRDEVVRETLSEGHLWNIEVYMRPWATWSHRTISSITPSEVAAAVHDLPCSLATKRKYSSSWTHFASWLVTEKYRLDKLSDAIKVGRRQPPEMWIPTEDAVRDLLAAANPQWKAIIATLAMCGLRAGELRALPWANVSLNGGYIRVTQAVKKNGLIGLPKTPKSVRDIPLPGFVGAMYSELPRNGELVFPGNGGRHMQPTALNALTPLIRHTQLHHRYLCQFVSTYR